MKKTKSILKLATLSILMGVTVIAILCVPAENAEWFYLNLILTKLIGTMIGMVTFILYRYWAATDDMIRKINDMMMDDKI